MPDASVPLPLTPVVNRLRDRIQNIVIATLSRAKAHNDEPPIAITDFARDVLQAQKPSELPFIDVIKLTSTVEVGFFFLGTLIASNQSKLIVVLLFNVDHGIDLVLLFLVLLFPSSISLHRRLLY